MEQQELKEAKVWDRDAIKQLVTTRDDAAVKALLVIYSKQTETEKCHDPIDPEVVRLFKRHQKRVDTARFGYQPINFDSVAGVRTVRGLVAVGRAADPARGLNAEEGCCCEDLCYAPDGMIYSCGCKHTKLGSVFDDPDLSWYERDYAHTGGRSPDDDL